MANARLLAAVLAVVVASSQVSSSVARRHGKPDPCGRGGGDAGELHEHGGGKRQRHRPHHCPPSGHGGTPAVMTVNGFRRGESGGGPSACDGRFHSDGEMVVALSTAWFDRGRRCHRLIRVTSEHGGGRTVEARVVDECDSRRGCRDDIVDSSPTPETHRRELAGRPAARTRWQRRRTDGACPPVSLLPAR